MASTSNEGSFRSGLVYVGHLPHGFYEEELKGYFSQFGTINKVKVARNKKNGHCKGYAFIEFECDEVAKIVAQTMNNYLMFNKLLKCQFVEPAVVHAGMLSGRCLRKKVSFAHRHAQSRKQHNKNRTTAEHRQRIKRLLHRERKKRLKLARVGINYEFPGYESCVTESDYGKKPSHILFGLESGTS